MKQGVAIWTIGETPTHDEDGQEILVLGSTGRWLVRGVRYYDGQPLRGWHIAYQSGETWWGLDSAEPIGMVDRVVDLQQLEQLKCFHGRLIPWFAEQGVEPHISEEDF